jgi:transcriptional antiterminator RfaH
VAQSKSVTEGDERVSTSNPTHDGGWAVVNTHPHKERLALDGLTRQGFHPYCPMITKRIRHARKFSNVLRPLFPSYVFVELDPSKHRWRPILSTFGVRTLVRHGERPALLAPEFVEALKARERDGAIARPDNDLAPGQDVRLSSGYFAGLTAQILELDQNERVTVLLNLLNGQVKAKVPVADVAALSA